VCARNNEKMIASVRNAFPKCGEESNIFPRKIGIFLHFFFKEKFGIS